MIPAEWIHRGEKALTAAEVKNLQPGTKITILGADRYGNSQRTDATVAQSGHRRVLVVMNWRTGERTILQIRDQENKKYVYSKGEEA